MGTTSTQYPTSMCPDTAPHARHRIAGTWRSDCPGVTATADLRARFLPSAEQVAVARAALGAAPAMTYAVVPIALPGKTHGVWQAGQTMRWPLQVILADSDGLRAATYRTDELARAALDADAGCTAYATIERDGHTVVWDGFCCNH